jgi:hypothetical protein
MVGGSSLVLNIKDMHALERARARLRLATDGGEQLELRFVASHHALQAQELVLAAAAAVGHAPSVAVVPSSRPSTAGSSRGVHPLASDLSAAESTPRFSFRGRAAAKPRSYSSSLLPF